MCIHGDGNVDPYEADRVRADLNRTVFGDKDIRERLHRCTGFISPDIYADVLHPTDVDILGIDDAAGVGNDAARRDRCGQSLITPIQEDQFCTYGVVSPCVF